MMSETEKSSFFSFVTFYSILLLLSNFHVARGGIDVGRPSVSTLLKQHESCIASLKEFTLQHPSKVSMDELPFNNDVFYLRYCLMDTTDDEQRKEHLLLNLQWRDTDRGKMITTNARNAYIQATTTTTSSSAWNNTPVQELLPHEPRIFQKYLSSSQVFTTTSDDRGDLLYMIRSREIDDDSLMNELLDRRQKETTTCDATTNSTTFSAKELATLDMIDWFLYGKELNSLVAMERSIKNDRLTYIITLNDLNGASLMSTNAMFQKAMKESNRLSQLYFSTQSTLFGPICLLNLPKWLNGLVNFFIPSTASIKFYHGPLKSSPSLQEISKPNSIYREEVMEYIKNEIYS